MAVAVGNGVGEGGLVGVSVLVGVCVFVMVGVAVKVAVLVGKADGVLETVGVLVASNRIAAGVIVGCISTRPFTSGVSRTPTQRVSEQSNNIRGSNASHIRRDPAGCFFADRCLAA